MGPVFPEGQADPPDDPTEEEEDPDAHQEGEGGLEEDLSTHDHHSDQHNTYDTTGDVMDQIWTEDKEDEEGGAKCVEFTDEDYTEKYKKTNQNISQLQDS